jgi:hypothetical protein
MKPKPNDTRPEQPDDLWTWFVIGLIYFCVTVALFAPLVWDRLHA